MLVTGDSAVAVYFDERQVKDAPMLVAQTSYGAYSSLLGGAADVFNYSNSKEEFDLAVQCAKYSALAYGAYRYLESEGAAGIFFDEKGGEGWINEGGLSESDLSRLAHPETVLREIKGPAGETVLKSDINLFCYPNGTSEEDLANRWTRLVIEGQLEGETCYYPVVLGPVEAGTEHIFDFVITRRGTSGPDIPADSRMIRIRSRLVPWQETDPKTETY